MLYALLASIGFGILYAETTAARATSAMLLVLVAVEVFALLAVSLILPPRLFRFANNDAAPFVQTQVIKRAVLGTLFVLTMNLAAWLILPGEIDLLEELYGYTLLAVFLFHGFAGAVAAYVVYLQQTHQYNSNQLVAVILLVTLIFFVLGLFLIALDWAIPRDAYVHLRDLTLISLILLGYGRAVYLMAHH